MANIQCWKVPFIPSEVDVLLCRSILRLVNVKEQTEREISMHLIANAVAPPEKPTL